MSENGTSPILVILGFLAVAGSFGTGLALSYRHPELDPTAEKAEEPPPENLMKTYYPFPDDIYITMPDGTMVIVSLSFYLEATPAELLHLQGKATEGQSEIKAALLEEAQLAAERSTDITSYRNELPAILQAKVNEKLGSKEEPEPIREVLLTRFMSR